MPASSGALAKAPCLALTCPRCFGHLLTLQTALARAAMRRRGSMAQRLRRLAPMAAAAGGLAQAPWWRSSSSTALEEQPSCLTLYDIPFMATPCCYDVVVSQRMRGWPLLCTAQHGLIDRGAGPTFLPSFRCCCCPACRPVRLPAVQPVWRPAQLVERPPAGPRPARGARPAGGRPPPGSSPARRPRLARARRAHVFASSRGGHAVCGAAGAAHGCRRAAGDGRGEATGHCRLCRCTRGRPCCVRAPLGAAGAAAV